jgi:oxalate decarboxylase
LTCASSSVINEKEKHVGEWSRRDFVATGAAAAGGLVAAGKASASTNTAGRQVTISSSDAPNLPKTRQTYKFPLTRTPPTVKTKGGTVVECTIKNFPVVGQSDAAIFLLKLEPGGLREPHWHPNAWELEYVVSGHARLGVVLPNGTYDLVDLGPGDVGFVPKGWGHYIENIGDTEMVMPITFGSNNPNDIGLSTFFSGVPTYAFARVLGLPESVMERADKPGRTVFIVP